MNNSLIWNPDKATLLLSITKPEIDPAIVSYAHKNGFVLKSEFHITLISFQNGKKILSLPENYILRDDILKLAETYTWNFEYIPEYLSLQRSLPEFSFSGVVQTPAHIRKSIIQKVLLPDIDDFFIKLRLLTKTSFSAPVPHITLFSWSDYLPEMNSGIGINSSDDLQKYFQNQLNVS